MMCFVEHFVLMVDVKSESPSAELRERIESNRQEMDRYLGVYPYDRLLFSLNYAISFEALADNGGHREELVWCARIYQDQQWDEWRRWVPLAGDGSECLVLIIGRQWLWWWLWCLWWVMDKSVLQPTFCLILVILNYKLSKTEIKMWSKLQLKTGTKIL